MIEDKGLGVLIDKTQIQNDTFLNAFDQILNNQRFVLIKSIFNLNVSPF